MMDTNREPPPLTEAGVTGTMRRRFLRGTTLALPAIVTLHSGGALAATSLGCGARINQVYTQVLCDFTPGKAPPDERMRVPVLLFKKLTYDSSKKKWIIDTTVNEGYYFKDPYFGLDVWRYAGAASGPAAGELVKNTAKNKELDAIKAYAAANSGGMGTSKAAILHVDMNGNYKAAGLPVGTDTSASQWIVTSWTGACYTSLYRHSL